MTEGRTDGDGDDAPGTVIEWGTTAAVGGLMFLLLRLLAVTHYHWEASFGLVETIDFGDVIGVLVGTFLGNPGLTGVLLAVLLPLLVAQRIRGHRKGHWALGRDLIIIVLAGLFSSGLISFRSRPLLLTVLVVSALLVLVLSRRGPAEKFVVRALGRMGVLVTMALLVVAALSDAPWVPEERIALQGGERLTGYVMDVTNVSTKVLISRTREVRIVPSKAVVHREELG